MTTRLDSLGRDPNGLASRVLLTQQPHIRNPVFPEVFRLPDINHAAGIDFCGRRTAATTSVTRSSAPAGRVGLDSGLWKHELHIVSVGKIAGQKRPPRPSVLHS